MTLIFYYVIVKNIMHLPKRAVGAAMASIMAVSCSDGRDITPEMRTESMAVCLPETANITELNVRTVSEAIDMSICLADRVDSEDSRALNAFLRTAVPAEVTFDDTSATYMTRVADNAGDGLRVAFVGPEHAASTDVLLRKLTDSKDPATAELTKDSEDNQLLLLSHPDSVSPSVMAYGILHFGFHAMRDSDCVQEETAALRLLSEAFASTDSRNRAWLQALVTKQAVQTSLDGNGQLLYTFDNDPQKMIPPPHVSDDANPKSYMNYDLWRTTAMIVSAITQTPSTPDDQAAKLRAEASRHCPRP